MPCLHPTPSLPYADPTGALHTALGFNRGFLPDSSISAYAKLVAMLAGVGSSGTIQEVLRGYIGDRSSPPVFSGERNLFDILGKGYQRPFELATLRLFNMQLVLSHCEQAAAGPCVECLYASMALASSSRGTVLVSRRSA